MHVEEEKETYWLISLEACEGKRKEEKKTFFSLHQDRRPRIIHRYTYLSTGGEKKSIRY